MKFHEFDSRTHAQSHDTYAQKHTHIGKHKKGKNFTVAQNTPRLLIKINENFLFPFDVSQHVKLIQQNNFKFLLFI